MFPLRTRAATLLTLLLCLTAYLLISACLFGNSVEVSGITTEEEGVSIVSISANGTWTSCIRSETDVFDCAFFSGDDLTSSFDLSSLELLFFLFLVDPLVVQLPDSVSAVQGSYSHPAPIAGPLEITGPLPSVAIDFNQTLTAEPGMALWIIGLPQSAHAAVATFNGVVRNPNPATVSFNLQISLPTGPTQIPAKVLAAAHVRTTSGENYYPPVFPCVTSLADAPALTVPIPMPGATAPLDLSAAASAATCDGRTFVFGGGPLLSEIPVLGPWGLAAFAVLLSLLGVAAILRRP